MCVLVLKSGLIIAKKEGKTTLIEQRPNPIDFGLY